MMIKSQVDCIVRFHNAKRLHELSRCVFSLVGQKYRPLHIIIVVQRFSDDEIAATQHALEPLFRLPNAPTLTIRNWQNEYPIDARTELLNMGLAAATGQYVSFLDYDDVLYPEAHEILVKRLEATGAGITFASVRVVYADVYRKFIHLVKQVKAPFSGENLKDLFRTNFCPIHSYLIDRSIVSQKDLSFDTNMTWEEDYDMLLKICANYSSDFDNLEVIIGDYYYKTDGSNSVPADGIPDAARMEEYDRVRAFIEVRRRTTLVAPEIQKQLGLPCPSANVTIRDALDGLLN